MKEKVDGYFKSLVSPAAQASTMADDSKTMCSKS